MRKIINLLILLVFTSSVSGQKMITIDGYLNDMQTVYHTEAGNQDWLWENQVHNRLNFHIYPASWLHASVQVRNRLVFGSTAARIPGYAEFGFSDAGLADLMLRADTVYNEDFGIIGSTMIDRLFAEFTFGDFVATIGRQRINWGQTFVWNPNDIFNAYSYFDVDYSERPGSDAIRLQYYTGMASNLELAAKVDSARQVTAAAYFRFNAFNYDFQLIGGILSEQDLVIGTGWSGSILGASFRGEFSYFRDLENFSDTTGYLLASLGIDYTFPSSLWLQTEVLYSAFASDAAFGNFLQFFGNEMNVKDLGFSEWSFFGSVSYPFSPLVSGSLAGIYFADWKGVFLGPSVDLSLAGNLKLSLIGQVISAELTDPAGNTSRNNTEIGYLRLKWNF